MTESEDVEEKFEAVGLLEAANSTRSTAAKAAWDEIRRREAELLTEEDRHDFKVIRAGYAGAYSRAKKKGELNTFITVADAIIIFRQQSRTCALTGQPFSSEKGHEGEVLKYPWSASLDRIDPRLGYILANTRWTWAIANMAKNEWPEPLFVAMCRAVVTYGDCTNPER